MSARVRLTSLVLVALLVAVGPAVGVQTSHWIHRNQADYSKGTFHRVVATNLGDLKLSRAVKTLLEQDARVSAVYALAEGPDGTVYAGTGPHGLLLQVKDEKVTPLHAFEDNSNIFSLLADGQGRLFVGVSGEKGRIYRFDKPGEEDKPVEVFTSDGEAQYVWAMQRTPDGNLYAATGPNGKLFEIAPDGSRSVILSSDETNLLSLLSDGKDLLYVGTDPNGLVYRVNRKTKEVFVVFDAPESEVSCLAMDSQGNIYAGTAEAAPQPTPQAQGEQPQGAAEKAGRPEGTGGVPLPSQPPEPPKPPSPPPQNPGEPNPIPREPRAGLAPSPGGLVPFVIGHSSLDIDSSFGFRVSDLINPHPDLPPEYRERGCCQALGVRVWFAISSDEPANPPPSGGPEKKPNPATAPAAPPQNPATPVLQPQETPKAQSQGNAVYRISPDGFVTEIFRQPILVYSIVEHRGTLLVGGSDGMVYQLNPKEEETLVVAKTEAKEVLNLLVARDGRVLLGMANVGSIAAMGGGFANDGTFISPVLDASQISRFGKIHLHGSLPPDTTLTISTRSGNVQDPSKAGWSPWTPDVAATEFVQVTAPAARFLQYRLTLGSKDGKQSPIVDDVDVAYQMPNLAPVVKSVTVSGAGQPPAKSPPNGNNPPGDAATPSPADAGNKVFTITWDAHDPNADPLRYSVYFRNGPASPWILLKDKLAEPKFEWDTRAAADGRYEVRVVASDAAANPPGDGKTGSRVSEAFTIDNTPPVIGDLKSSVRGRTVTITARIVDRTSTVANCEYSVDSATDWQAVLPSDKIWDGPDETVNFTIGGLSAGPHQITLRATDAKGNQAFETLQVTLPAPAVRR